MSPGVRLALLGLLFAVSGMARVMAQAPSGEVGAAIDAGDPDELAVRQAAARVAPSIVRIETIGGLEQVGEVLVGDGPTTGLIVDSAGYVVSSTFNFVRLPTSILVVMADGQRLPAQVVARDQSRKLALLKVAAASPLPVPEAAPIGEVAVGQTAIAAGRTQHSDHLNLSVGIISAKNRIFGRAVQTDAKVSPSNYGGPLIDLRGRVIGLLVPMSPDGTDEMAGAEWYDGGIGFAVPLTELNQRLARLKKGETLNPGLLGISLKPGDMYSQPAEVVAVHPRSPLYQAGMKPGDRIVELNGQPISRLVQLRHAVGPLYAGDSVKLVAMRGMDRKEFSIPLVPELAPYQHPFLGIIPGRGADDAGPGVLIGVLYPDSGAARAGLRVGDRIVAIGDRPVPRPTLLRETMIALEPGQTVPIKYVRSGAESSSSITLGTLPESLPPEGLVSALAPSAPAEGAATKVVPIKLPEEPNACGLLIPKTYRPERPASLVVYLPPPGKLADDVLLKRWQAVAEQHGLLVAAPQSEDPERWNPTEVLFIRKVVEHVLGNYAVDRQRVVIAGYKSGGGMGFLATFKNRDLFRGLVAIEAPIPRMQRPSELEPLERMAVVVGIAEKSEIKDRLQATVEALRELKLPVVVLKQPAEPHDLSDQELASVAQWIETLDRL